MGQAPFRDQTLKLIDRYWKEARTVKKWEADRYREIWKVQQPALRRLSEQFGETRPSKAPTESRVRSMSWEDFLARVRQDAYHGFQERCGLLERMQSAFRKYPDFTAMPPEIRKAVAGLPSSEEKHWAWFGSMRGAGYFHEAVRNNNRYLSLALDRIPLDGPVTRAQYDAYVREFEWAFPDGGDGIGVASRLLALKRPDQFICFDSRNRKELCRDLGIKQSGMDYRRYWEEIIERIRVSPWWNSERPPEREAALAWDGRAALLDAIFYEPGLKQS